MIALEDRRHHHLMHARRPRYVHGATKHEITPGPTLISDVQLLSKHFILGSLKLARTSLGRGAQRITPVGFL